MSNRRPLWSEAETEFLIKLAHKGVSNEVIATEMEYEDGLKPHSPQAVGEERKRLNLPGADALTAMNAATTTQEAVRMATARKLTPPPAEDKTQEGPAQENDTAEKPPEPAEPARVIKVGFRPEFVAACKKKDIVVIGGMGPAECIDVQKGNFGGFDMNVAVVREIHSTSNPVTKRLDLEKFPDNVRQLASAATMHQVLDKIENGQCDVSMVAANGQRLSVLYTSMAQSTDINDVANLLCHMQGRSRTATGEYNNTEVTFGDQAKKMIAAEFAIATGTTFDKSLRLVNERLEKGLAKDAAILAEARAAALAAAASSPESP